VHKKAESDQGTGDTGDIGSPVTGLGIVMRKH
jgi:hypothetical protein